MVSTPSLAATLDRIRAFARAMDWKPARVAREAGLADIATRNMAREDWSPTSSTIRRLEALIPDKWSAGDPAPSGDQRAQRIETASLAAAATEATTAGDQAIDEARADIGRRHRRGSA